MLFQHIPNLIQPAFCKNLLCNCLFRPGIAKRFKIRRIEVAILEWDALIFRKQLHSYWAAEAAEAFIMNFFRPGGVFLHMGLKCWKRSKKIQLPLLLCDVMRSRFLIITETKTETPNSWDRWEGLRSIISSSSFCSRILSPGSPDRLPTTFPWGMPNKSRRRVD